jgi:hypothetical protein
MSMLLSISEMTMFYGLDIGYFSRGKGGSFFGYPEGGEVPD